MLSSIFLASIISLLIRINSQEQFVEDVAESGSPVTITYAALQDLQPEDGSSELEANIVKDNSTYWDESTVHKWIIRDLENGYYEIKSNMNDLCFDIFCGHTYAGVKLVQYTCHNGDNQQYKFTDISTFPQFPLYTIQAKHSDLYISVNLTDLEANFLGVGKIHQDNARNDFRGQAFRLYL